jgi:MFS transporter, PAT family, beta-lactamase induction signal transducer AmpG
MANQSNTSRGILADKLGWVSFFILTTVVTMPALVLLVWLARRSAAQNAA